MTDEKLQESRNYDDLKNLIIQIAKETPNDMSLGIKIRLFTESLKNDIILRPDQLERKTI
jgi:hypothetical protein